MKTCSPAMQTINPLSTTLKLNILLSVLLTVLKFRFSRVRKYFWLRLMVERSRETFMMDSSRAEVCSGGVPFLEGRRAEGDSFSTCKGGSGSACGHPCFLWRDIAEECGSAITPKACVQHRDKSHVQQFRSLPSSQRTYSSHC